MSKRILVILCLGLFCLSGRAAQVVWNAQDLTAAGEPVRSLSLFPLGAPMTNGAGAIVMRDWVTRSTGTNGSLTISNVYGGSYRSEFAGTKTTTTNYYVFPVTNGLINASDFVSPATNGQSGIVAYSQQQADGKFYPLTSNPSNYLTAAGTISNAALAFNATNVTGNLQGGSNLDYRAVIKITTNFVSSSNAFYVRNLTTGLSNGVSFDMTPLNQTWYPVNGHDWTNSNNSFHFYVVPPSDPDLGGSAVFAKNTNSPATNNWLAAYVSAFPDDVAPVSSHSISDLDGEILNNTAFLSSNEVYAASSAPLVTNNFGYEVFGARALATFTNQGTVDATNFVLVSKASWSGTYRRPYLGINTFAALGSVGTPTSGLCESNCLYFIEGVITNVLPVWSSVTPEPIWFGIDDGLFASNLTASGLYTFDSRFPNGLTNIASRLHAVGMKLAVYTTLEPDQISRSSSGAIPAIHKTNLQTNCDLLAAWGVDGFKNDGPGAIDGFSPFEQTGWVRYFHQMLASAVVNSGRSIMIESAGLPRLLPSGVMVGFIGWEPENLNVLRMHPPAPNSSDIVDYGTLTNWLDWAQPWREATRPGFQLDLDGGAGGAGAENRSGVGTSCLMSAPLQIATPFQDLTFWTNVEALAIDQDADVIAGRQVYSNAAALVYAKPIRSGKSVAVGVMNRAGGSQNITAAWTNVGVAAGRALVRDVWARQDLGWFTNTFTTNVASHDLALLTITQETNYSSIQPLTIVTNLLSSWPLVPPYPGASDFVSSNGTVFIRGSTNGAGGGTNRWTSTNRLAF